MGGVPEAQTARLTVGKTTEDGKKYIGLSSLGINPRAASGLGFALLGTVGQTLNYFIPIQASAMVSAGLGILSTDQNPIQVAPHWTQEISSTLLRLDGLGNHGR
jgi:hypothetical protein